MAYHVWLEDCDIRHKHRNLKYFVYKYLKSTFPCGTSYVLEKKRFLSSDDGK